MTSNNRVCALAISAILATAPVAHATLATAASFEQKVGNAASIIIGKCVRQESRFDPSGRWILTYSTFQIEKAMKGAAAPEITIVTPGGQVGSLHQSSIGIPAFQTGAENVIFVKNSNAGPTVLYFDQGAYDVKTDARGQRVVIPVPSDLVTIDPQRGVAVAPDNTPQALPDFERRVGDTLRDQRNDKNRMNMLAAEKLRQEASLWTVVKQNRWTVLLALAGIAYATWRLIRR
jgi:hypothetical protein